MVSMVIDCCLWSKIRDQIDSLLSGQSVPGLHLDRGNPNRGPNDLRTWYVTVWCGGVVVVTV